MRKNWILLRPKKTTSFKSLAAHLSQKSIRTNRRLVQLCSTTSQQTSGTAITFDRARWTSGEAITCTKSRSISGTALSYTRFVCLLVCLRSATAFFLRGQLPGEDLRRSPLPPRRLVNPRLCRSLCSLSPCTFVMHPASGPYPPLSSCPVHIPYRVSGLSLPCFPVLHIYSNPTERNPSTQIKPHKQTVLIHYFNNQTTKTAVNHNLVSLTVDSNRFWGQY